MNSLEMGSRWDGLIEVGKSSLSPPSVVGLPFHMQHISGTRDVAWYHRVAQKLALGPYSLNVLGISRVYI